MTPLGSPVLPLEKMMVAMSSSPTFCACPDGLFDKSHGQEPGNEGGDQTFEYSRFIGKILEHDGLRRRLNVNALQKSARRDHRFQFALFGARSQNFVGSRVVQIDRDLPHQQERRG